ncbi:membrane protein BRI3-like, partial [Cylas formicarius]|uniref:membrane protein BRI3-like n=1 Tax=Cylas formicarius TaxID=197179 RepID=UPI0029588745
TQSRSKIALHASAGVRLATIVEHSWWRNINWEKLREDFAFLLVRNKRSGAPSPGFVHNVPPAIAYSEQHHPPGPPQMAPTQTTTVVHVSAPATGPGSCPVCKNKSWTGTYPCCAWLLCFFCFPCGIICCCCMRKKKCSKCGFTVG